MRKKTSSQTAMWVCFFRALATNAGVSQILPDPVAENFLPLPLRWLSQSRFMQFSFRRMLTRRPGTHRMAQILLRQRFAEDALTRAISEKNVTQYIILGAGWDSFSVRCPALVSQLRVFELDHPATQFAKRTQLSERGFSLPANVTFVPIDFESERIGERLLASGFDPKQTTFVTWMGVTYYLHEETVWAVFKELAQTCQAGCMIAFDYASKPDYDKLSPKQHKRTRYFWRMVDIGMRIIGEPFRTLFNTQKLHERFLHEAFTLSDDLTVGIFSQRLTQEERGYFHPAGRTRIVLVSHSGLV